MRAMLREAIRHPSVRIIPLALALAGSAASSLASVTLDVRRVEAPPNIDGLLDDPAWLNVEAYEGFRTASPDIGLVPEQATSVRVANDGEHLYFAIRALESDPAAIKSSIVRWDELFAGDYVGVYVDALNDSQSAWGFFVNAHGSQGDRLLGTDDVGDPAPDNVWQAAASRDSLGYTVEIAVPLRSLRYQAGERVEMGIGFVRHISRRTEYSHFPDYSPFAGSLMAQLGSAEFQGLPWQRTWELLPSVVHVDDRAREGDELLRQDEPSGTELGLTAKLGITSTSTLDVAVNPDFSQIEADAGQVDLNLRSLVYYPEKRPFFQEGSDYFTVAATDASAFASVLHTRTIAAPRLGFRMTGKAGKRNVLGFLYADDEAPGVADSSGRRAVFGAARYRRQLDEQSFAGAMYTHRSYRGRTNHVGGFDALWRAAESTTFQGNALLASTEDGGQTNRTHHLAGEWLYRTRTNFARIRMHDVSRNFGLDSGFLPRDGVVQFQPSVRRYLYPGDTLQNINVGYWSYVLEDKYEDDVEQWHNFFAWLTMPRSTVIGLWKFFGNELYSNGDFDVDGWYVTASSQLLNSLHVSFSHRGEGKPRFVSTDPFQGDQKTSSLGLNYEPSPRLRAELDLHRQVFDRRSTGSRIFDDRIARAKTTLQLHRYFSLRAVVEYRETHVGGSPLDRGLQGELLASFNYLPGTVLYAGYGSLYRSGNTLPLDMNPDGRDDLLETDRSLFLKASYNWRI